MGCGASAAPATANTQQPQQEGTKFISVHGNTDGDDCEVSSPTSRHKGPRRVTIPEIQQQRVRFHDQASGKQLFFMVNDDNKLVYEIDGNQRPPVSRLHYDSYFSFLRFPDTGKGGKLPPDHVDILGGLRVLCARCEPAVLHNIPKDMLIEYDMPGGLRRDMRVFAAQDIIVEAGGMAVKKGDRGTVWGPSNTDDKLRVNVKWDERKDGKTSRINVYPEEVSIGCDLPGGFLRGQKVRATCDIRTDESEEVAIAAGDCGIVWGPHDREDPLSPKSRSKMDMINVRWDERRDGSRRRINVHPEEIAKFIYPVAPKGAQA